MHPISFRFSDPYLNRFLQPDSIIPSLYNPQNLNRYSFVGNNPINFSDPTGHWRTEDTGSRDGCYDPKYCNGGQQKSADELKKMRGNKTPIGWENIINKITPHGFKTSINITAGWDSNLIANGQKVPTIFYWGLSLVTDDDGGFQLYSETLDISFTPTLHLGAAEKAQPSFLYGAGFSVTKGVIWGNGFRTSDYDKVSRNVGLSGELTGDYWQSYSNPDVKGIDVGISEGSPSTWAISTNAHSLFDRISLFFWKP